MQLLDAVNLIMPKLGERPVTSLDVKHPTVAVLLPIIDRVQRSTLGRGWWFNKYDYTAYPAVDGTITLGVDTLSFVPDCPDFAVARGLKLFNPGTMSYTYDVPVQGVVTQHVEFEELPESLAHFILYSSAVEAYATDLGVTQELSVWQTKAGQGWSDFVAEHLRQKKFSTRRRGTWQRYRRALQG